MRNKNQKITLDGLAQLLKSEIGGVKVEVGGIKKDIKDIKQEVTKISKKLNNFVEDYTEIVFKN